MSLHHCGRCCKFLAGSRLAPCFHGRLLAWLFLVLLSDTRWPVMAQDVTPPVLDVLNVAAYVYHFSIIVNLDEDGTVYCGAIEDAGSGTVTPSVYQMQTGSGLDGHASTPASGNVHTGLDIVGLSVGTTYDVYCYAEDTSLNGLSVAAIDATKQTVTTQTGGDYVTPVLSYVAPYVTVDNTAASIHAQLSEDGTLWCVAKQDYGSGTTTPTSAEIRLNANVDAWGTASITAASGYQAILRLAPLLENTTYDAYCFAEDMTGNGIDNTPAFVEDPTAIPGTKQTFTTLILYSATHLQALTPSGMLQYNAEPAAWNTGLPQCFISGSQERRDLESWSTPLTLKGAVLVSPVASDARASCSKVPAAPPDSRQFVALLRRGFCTFSEKARRVARAGYHAILVIDSQLMLPNGLPDMLAEDGHDEVSIPGWIVNRTDGEALLAAVEAAVDAPVTIDVTDVYRKPRLGSFQRDMFGLRNYATK